MYNVNEIEATLKQQPIWLVDKFDLRDMSLTQYLKRHSDAVLFCPFAYEHVILGTSKRKNIIVKAEDRVFYSIVTIMNGSVITSEFIKH